MNVPDIVRKLSDIVGQEKAEDVVTRAARELGVRRTETEWEAIDRLLAKLAEHPGVIGTAARVMRRRAQMDRALAEIDRSRPNTTGPGSAPPASASSTPHQRLVGMLASALGDEKAASLIATAAKRRGLSTSRLNRDQCIGILEDLASEEGLVGTVARFAKARAHLELGD